MASLNTLTNISMEILIVFLSTSLICLGYTFLFIILLACWTYKQFVLKLAQKDSKVGKILEGIDGLYAGQDPYQDPLVVLLPCYSLAEKLDIPTVVKVLNENVIRPNIYPELSQKIVRKYGYHFWYSVDNFKVENHVHYIKSDYPNMPITRTQMRDMVMNKLAKLPFDSTMSPWEILIIPNMIDDRDPEVKSVFILRVNHCLMDGYSIANFLNKVAAKPWKMFGPEKLEEKRRNSHKFVEIYKFIMLFFTGPYHLLKSFVFTSDRHQFVQNTYKSDFEKSYNTQCTPLIPDTRLKSVKNAYGVSMSGLIVTLFAQATWKCMKRAGIPVSSTIHGLITFPLPGHEDILSNHWSIVRLPIKINDVDPTNTLKFVETELQSLKNSVKPLIFFYANILIALTPLWFRINPKSVTPSTFVLTNFPGPVEPSDIFGCRMKYSTLGGKPSRGISFVVGSFSSFGNFWFDAGGPVCNLPNQRDADFLSDSVLDTLAFLEAKIKVN